MEQKIGNFLTNSPKRGRVKEEIPEKSINNQITKWKRAGYREE